MKKPGTRKLAQKGFGWEAGHNGDGHDEGENLSHGRLIDIGRESTQSHEIAVDPDGVLQFLGQDGHGRDGNVDCE